MCHIIDHQFNLPIIWKIVEQIKLTMELFTQKCTFLPVVIGNFNIEISHTKEKDMEYMLIIAVIYRGE